MPGRFRGRFAAIGPENTQATWHLGKLAGHANRPSGLLHLHLFGAHSLRFGEKLQLQNGVWARIDETGDHFLAGAAFGTLAADTSGQAVSMRNT